MTQVQTRLILICVSIFVQIGSFALADSFVISGGGLVEGTVLNPKENPVKIQTNSGTILTIDKNLIKEKPGDMRDARILYESFAPIESDTVENHLKIATWCNEHYLNDLSRLHYNRVIELDPENKEARGRLGYTKDKTGQWTTAEQRMTGRGYVQYKGQWKMPQEVWIAERTANRKDAETRWKVNLKKARNSIGNDQTRQKIESISDPFAAAPLLDALSKEGKPEVRIIYLRALSNIGTPEAVLGIIHWYMSEKNEEVCHCCLDQIRKHPEAIPSAGAEYSKYISAIGQDGISTRDPQTIEKAAYAIGEIGDRSSINNLIGALVTRHKSIVETGSGDRTNAGFNSSGGIGFSQGSRPVEKIDQSENRAVLEALRKLTGNNFLYDQKAWRNWLQDKRKTVSFDARRG